MDTYMVVLRIIHILAGVFWVGAALTVILFIQPTAREVGPAAGPFISHLAGRKRLVEFVLGAGGLTVLAGLLLYWRDSAGLNPDWIGSAEGVALTVGALCAIAALAIGGSVIRPGIRASLAIGREVAAGGGPPTPEQAARLQALQERAHTAGKVIVPLLIVAVVAMASARYL